MLEFYKDCKWFSVPYALYFNPANPISIIQMLLDVQVILLDILTEILLQSLHYLGDTS